MSVANTMLDKAIANLNAAKIINNYSMDEEQLNIVAFHLSQSIEFSIKFLLELNGVSIPKTHNLETLIVLADKNKVNLLLNTYLKEHAEMFSSWEEKSRYILGYSIKHIKIQNSLVHIENYITLLKEKYKK